MKVTRKFIEGFVEGCYENGLTEKQASWLLDRYIAEGNGEIMEKSAAGKSILNLLLLLLALGGGAYGLDRLGGTNTALGKWLKDNLGAGNWGIKDALEGLFAPAANPTAPANSTSAGESAGATTTNTAGKPQEGTISPEQAAAAARGKEVIQQATKWFNDTARPRISGLVDKVKNRQPMLINMAGKPTQTDAVPPEQDVPIAPVPEAQTTEVPQTDLNLPDIPQAQPAVDATSTVDFNAPQALGTPTELKLQEAGEWLKDNVRPRIPGFVDTVKRLPAYAANQAATMGYTQQPIINMAGKPTQITATPPTPNVSLAPAPKAQATEATWPDLNLPAIPEAEPSVDNASIPVDLGSPEVRGQVYAAFGPAAERQRRKAYHQEMRDMTNNALNNLAPMEDPLGEDTQLQEGVDHASKIKDLEENLRYYELMRQHERAKASLQRKAKLQEYIPLFKQEEGPLEIPYENVDFPEDKNVAPIRDNRASLSIPKPTSKSQSTWFSMVPPVDTNEMRNYLHPDKPKEKTVGEHLLDSVRNAPAGMTY